MTIYRRRGDQGLLKDPRNLSNKAIQREMIDDILCFLQASSFPHQISSKILQAPTSKDFVKVFEFLYGFIDNSEKIGQKIEDEFPRLMKQLRYPFPVAKSAMFTIGSLHTWPSLLGALHWLTQLIEMSRDIDPEDVLYSQNDKDPLSFCEKLIHPFFEKTYKDFMSNIVDHEEDDLKLKDAILKQTGAIEEDLESLEIEEEILQQKLNDLESEPNRLKETQQNIEFWKGQCEKMEREQEDMKDKKKMREAEMKRLNEEIKKYDYRRVKQIHFHGSMEHEKERLKSRLKAVEAENEVLQAKCWEKQIMFSKVSSKLDKKLAEYNDQRRNISFDPSAIQYLNGRDIEMKFEHQETELNNQSKFKTVIKSALIEAQNRALADVRNTESDCITQQAKYEKYIDSAKEAQSELESLQAKLERANLEIDESIEKNEQEQRHLDDELAALKEENKMLETGSSALLGSKKLELEQMKEKLEFEKEEIDGKLVNIADFLAKVSQKATEHKEAIKAGMSRIEELHLIRKEDLKKTEPLA